MKTTEFVARSRIEAPAQDVYAWHVRSGALERLEPPWERVEILGREGGVEDGGKVELRMRVLGPVRRRWVAVHRGIEKGRRFQDEQVEGPFARWVHTHAFEPDGPAASWLEDRMEYALPLGPLGRALGGPLVRARLARAFRWRHALTQGDLERHRAFAAKGPRRIGVTGASGLVGSALIPFLTAGGHEARRLARPDALTPGALEGLDAIVHLAGENIAGGRWSAARKERIRASRADGTRRIAEAIAALERPPRVLVSASAIGFYGDRGDEEVDETSAPGAGFLADVCRAWEAATEPAARRGVRVVNLRIGVVLAAAGGALAKMLTPFKLGAGGRVGPGTQWLSWISLDDLLGAIHFAIMEDALAGPVNAVAPRAARQSDFARALGGVLRRPAIVPTPAAAVRLLFGELGQALLLEGQHVHPRALERAGFRFRHVDLEGALRFELGRLKD